jgi:uncharacterized protein (TIGR00369 family)
MANGFNALLGVRHIGLRDDGYWIEIDAGDAHVHDKGLVHGGVILSLLDIAMSRAVRHAADPESYMPTIEFNRGIVRACGIVLAASRTLTRVEGKIVDADGRIAAIGRGTFMKPR